MLRLALGAAIATAGVAAFGTPATAAPLTGTIAGKAGPTGVNVTMTDAHGHDRSNLPTSMATLRTDGGGDLWVYCIDIDHEAGSTYQEASWDASGVARLDKVNWVLRHSYPVVDDMDRLAADSGVPYLTEQAAVTATQAAIWHFSDGYQLTKVLTPHKQIAHQVNALYKYLAGKANTGAGQQPAPSLAFSVPTVSGQAGGVLGPFRVRSSVDAPVSLRLSEGAPAGSQILVQRDGTGDKAASDSARDGDNVFVRVPAGTAPGSLTLTGTVIGRAAVGRVFVGRGSDDGAQKLILAGTDEVTADADGTVSWSATPTAQFSATAATDCDTVDGGVRVTVTNSGNAGGKATVRTADFSKTVDVPAHQSRTVRVPVVEGADYTITVSAGELHRTLSGTRTCGGAGPSAPASPSPSTSGRAGGGGLPVTGTSLPVIVGAGVLLLAAGGALLLILRRRRNQAA